MKWNGRQFVLDNKIELYFGIFCFVVGILIVWGILR